MFSPYQLYYLIKDETLDLISDEDLIKFMKETFNGVCQGSLELLSGRELAKRHPYKDPVEAVDLSESEQEFRLCLHNYIISQSLERQNWILKTINLLDYNN